MTNPEPAVVVVKVNKSEEVDEFMKKLDYSLKKEVQAIREIIKGANKDITEEVKWNAPSFSYTEYIATFNLFNNEAVRLIFHNPEIVNIKSDILEGTFKDRRMVYFKDLAEVKAKKAELERIITELLKKIKKHPLL